VVERSASTAIIAWVSVCERHASPARQSMGHSAVHSMVPQCRALDRCGDITSHAALHPSIVPAESLRGLPAPVSVVGKVAGTAVLQSQLHAYVRAVRRAPYIHVYRHAPPFCFFTEFGYSTVRVEFSQNKLGSTTLASRRARRHRHRGSTPFPEETLQSGCVP
jgi:hypothetical protein